MVNSEDLIQAVKKHKAIWDLEDERYHNKNFKEDAWTGVCLDMYSDWKTLPEGERYVRQMELKKKWNNIRDYYKKLLSEQRSGEQARAKKRRYLYSDILEFIRPVYDKRRPETVSHTHSIDSFNDESNISVSSLQIVESDEQQHDSDNKTLEEMETETFIGIPTNKVSAPISQPIIRTQQRRNIRLSPRKRKKIPQLTLFERSIIKSLENKMAPKEDDPDLSFLKSLLPDVKKLTDSQKFDFKLGIMELYKTISKTPNDQRHGHEYDHDAETYIKVETVQITNEDS